MVYDFRSRKDSHANKDGTAIPSPDRPIPQRSATEPLGVRRHAHAASLHRLPTSSDASYHDTQSDDDRYWEVQGEERARFRTRGTTELEEQVRETRRHCAAHQPGQTMVDRAGLHGHWRAAILWTTTTWTATLEHGICLGVMVYDDRDACIIWQWCLGFRRGDLGVKWARIGCFIRQ